MPEVSDLLKSFLTISSNLNKQTSLNLIPWHKEVLRNNPIVLLTYKLIWTKTAITENLLKEDICKAEFRCCNKTDNVQWEQKFCCNIFARTNSGCCCCANKVSWHKRSIEDTYRCVWDFVRYTNKCDNNGTHCLHSF